MLLPGNASRRRGCTGQNGDYANALGGHAQSLEYRSRVSIKLKESLEKELGRLRGLEEQLEKEMEAYAENHEETTEDFSNLLSMKGIGFIAAVRLLYLFRKHPDANRNEIMALAGLDQVQRQSGPSLQG
jgi:transposase